MHTFSFFAHQSWLQLGRWIFLLILTLAFSQCTLTEVAANDSMWWEEAQLFGQTPMPGYFPGEVKVSAWGDTLETEEELTQIETEVKLAKLENAKYVGSISAFSPGKQAFDAYPELYDAVVIDIDGNWSDIAWKQNLYFLSTNEPIYQNYLKQQVRWLIDAGVDAILIDEIEGVAGTLNRGGSFGDVDMALFNDYLLTQYTAEQLEQYFGIDIQNFNYGDYIRNRGSAQQYRDYPFGIPLFEEYRDFLRVSTRSFMKELINYGKDYAQNQHGREISFTANIYGYHPHQLLFADLLDYYTVEYGFREDGYAPESHTTPFLMIGNSRGARSLVLPGVYTGNEIYEWDTTDIGGLWLFECYVTGNTFFHSRTLYGGTSSVDGSEVEFSLNADKNSEHLNYILDNEAIFTGERQAKVCVLFPYASDYINFVRYDWAGTAFALLDAHIAYDVITLGNDRFLEDDFASKDLSQYETLVLPAAKNMSQAHLDKLLAFVEAGGKLIVVGDDSGSHTETNGIVDRPEWESATELGSRSYGAGQIHVLREQWGLDYHESRDPAQLPELANLFSSNERITQANASKTLHMHPYYNESENVFAVHMLNYDFNSDTHQLTPAPGFALAAELPSELQSENDLIATQIFPDGTAVPLSMQLDSSNSALVSVDVQPVKLHSAVVFQSAAQAQQNADAAIADAETFLQSQNPDRLSRFDAASARNAINHAYENENYLTAQSLAHKMKRDAAEAMRPKVLFSESNGEASFLDRGQAELRNPDDPDQVHLGDLEEILRDEFKMTSTKEYITTELLASYDILVINSPWDWFVQDEIDRIHEFVEKGGGLLVLGNPSLNGALAPITEPYGVYVHGEVLSKEDANTFGNFTATGDLNHPALSSGNIMSLNWPTRLTVNAPAQSIMKTGPGAWMDEVTQNQERDPGEREGNFSLAAAWEQNGNRVFVLADNAFDNAFLSASRNDLIARSALRWLADSKAAPTNQITPDDSGYWDWVAQYFPNAKDKNSAGSTDEWNPSLDPDGDQVNNLLEFLTDTNPLIKNDQSLPKSYSLPDAGNTLVLTIPMNALEERHWLVIERSSDLENWTQVSPISETTSNNELSCSMPLNPASASNYFRISAKFD